MSSGGQPNRCAGEDPGRPRDELRLVRTPLRWTLAPERAALLVRDDPRPFALIGSWAGGGALVGSDPIRVAGAEEDPFALLEDQPAVRVAGAEEDPFGLCEDQPVVRDPLPEGVGGGWFGYLGYQLGRRLEPVGASPPETAGLPEFELAFYDHLLHLDRHGRWLFEALWSERRARVLRERLTTLQARAAAMPTPRPFATHPWRPTPASRGHSLAVSACRDRIHAGDLFQANICVRLESRLNGAPLDLFAVAAAELAPERAAFLSGPWGAVASLSPELFLERHGRVVRSAPIKGTRPRPPDAQHSGAQRDALLASAKDRAENVMIVDLVRNDLGRVCAPGSINVDALQQARGHTGVWHLVSEVSGELREEVGDGRLIRAAFPPGSVSGAPKVAALNVIAELESTPRGVYTGAIGFASPLAGLELSVAIRTFEVRGEQIWLGVGGGVVADSEPLDEAAECTVKAAPLLAAIGARPAPQEVIAPIGASAGAAVSPAADGLGSGAAGSPAAAGFGSRAATRPPPRPRRLGPRPVSRPDPRAGVFETLLIADGRAVALEAHLTRLARSVGVLYARPLPAGLADELREAAHQVDRARLRVDVRPGAGELQTQIAVTGLASRRVPVRLRPATLPGGLGPHKWADRQLLVALSDGDTEPLLCDLDGFVLESARASVFVVAADGVVLTPPQDGRILPGTTASRVLALARELGLPARAEPIHLGRLTAAAELFVTGALGGVEPALVVTDSIVGSSRRVRDDSVTVRLAAALRRADAGASLAPA